ncbi:hypothetical protein [Cellulomonas sp. P24]|nr:hypothetical protein [Cellulomonas sp. P24]
MLGAEAVGDALAVAVGVVAPGIGTEPAVGAVMGENSPLSAM